MVIKGNICEDNKNEKMVAMWKESKTKKQVIVTTTKFKVWLVSKIKMVV